MLVGGSRMVSRGQAYTLEGVLAAILVVTATVYGVQAIDTQAWEDETRTETEQLEQRASDVLTLAGESGALRNAVLCYREGNPISGNRDGELSEFERMLNTSFDRQAAQYQLQFAYWNSSDQRETRTVSRTGQSSSVPTAAAVASATVTIADSTNITTRQTNCKPFDSELTVKDTEDSFYMSDVNDDSPLFNLVEVRLTVW